MSSSRPIPVPSSSRPIPVQRPAQSGSSTAHAKAPQAPVIGSLPAPRFSLDMPDMCLPPSSPDAWSLAAAASAPKAAPRVVGVSSAPAVSFMGKAAAAAARLPAATLSSSPTVLSILQQRAEHAGRPAAGANGVAGDAALTAGMRGFSISGGGSASSDPFAKADVSDSSPLRPADGGLAAALQQRSSIGGSANVGGAGSGAAPKPASSGAGAILLSASFREAGSYMANRAPVTISEEEQDAALDSSDDEVSSRPAASSAAPARHGARADSVLTEDDDDDDEDDAAPGRGARNDAADDLHL